MPVTVCPRCTRSPGPRPGRLCRSSTLPGAQSIAGLAERRQSPPCHRSAANPPTQYRRRRSSRRRRMISASRCRVGTDAATADVARLLLLLTLTSSAAATLTPMTSTSNVASLTTSRCRAASAISVSFKMSDSAASTSNGRFPAAVKHKNVGLTFIISCHSRRKSLSSCLWHTTCITN